MRSTFPLREVTDGTNKRQLRVLVISSGGRDTAQTAQNVCDRQQPVCGARQREPVQRKRSFQARLGPTAADGGEQPRTRAGSVRGRDLRPLSPLPFAADRMSVKAPTNQ